MVKSVVEETKTAKAMPKAMDGESWLVLYRTEEHFSDEGRRIAPAALHLLLARKGYFSIAGAGSVRLELVTVPTRDDGSVLAATLAGTLSMGRATYCNRAFVQGLVEAAPNAGQVEGLLAITQRVQQLAAVDAWQRRSLETFARQAGWETCVISAKEYGFVFLPKRSFFALKPAEGEGPDRLRFTHALYDVLASKHELMSMVGLEKLIEVDRRAIANGLALREVRS